VTGVVQLWHARAANVDADLASLLTDAERSRGERFVFEGNRQEFVLGRAMLRLVLARQLGVSPREVPFRLGPFGKPELAGECSPPVHFNVSHSAGLVVAAFSLEGQVGVDVEDAERLISPAVLRQVFTPDELQSWESLSPGQQGRAAAAHWTLKEAYLKARGAGLNVPLQGFAFDESAGEPRIRFGSLIDDEASRWRFYQARLAPRHVVSLAQCDAAARVELHDFDPQSSNQARHERSFEPLVAVG